MLIPLTELTTHLLKKKQGSDDSDWKQDVLLDYVY